MRNLTATLCLTIAVLLGGAGMSFALLPCPSEKNPTASPWSECSGTWVDKGGNKYVGEFRDRKPDGQGTYNYVNGIVKEGIFKDGKFQIAQKVTPSVIPKQDVKKTARQPSSKAVIDDQFRVALVIGNGDYGSMGTLRNPVNDAQLMTKTLGNLGFVVIEEINATQKRMKKAVKGFYARLDKGGDNSVGLFYFAGHGMISSGLNYLIPVDANIDVEGDISIESVDAAANGTKRGDGIRLTSFVDCPTILTEFKNI